MIFCADFSEIWRGVDFLMVSSICSWRFAPPVSGFGARQTASSSDQGGDYTSDLGKAADIVGNIRHPDLGLCTGNANGPDGQSHHVLLDSEDMLSRGAVLGFCAVAAPDMFGHWSARGFAVVDVADKPLARHECLIGLRAVGAVSPDARPGICRIQQALAQHTSVMTGGIRDIPNGG